MTRGLLLFLGCACAPAPLSTDPGAPAQEPRKSAEERPEERPEGSYAPVVAEPCASENYRQPPEGRLELVARSTGTNVDVSLRNTGPVRLCVYSHIATHEWQSDWLTIQYEDGERYHHIPRSIALNDDRDRSAPVSVWLEPGAVLSHSVDIAAWAARPRNGGEPLAYGLGYAHAVYDTSGESRAWSGRLLAKVEPIPAPAPGPSP